MFLKIMLLSWGLFLGFSAIASSGYKYRPGLDINVPIIKPTNPELR